MLTLIEEIKLGGNQEAYICLKDTSLVERVDLIKDFFICACQGQHDEKALLFLDWFFKANVELSNFRKEGGILESHYAALAKEIYLCVTNDRFSSLPKTREKIFLWIADWCYRTRDEKEADELFKFLITLRFECSENEKILVEVFRRAVDLKRIIRPAFFKDRIFRHIDLIVSAGREEHSHGLDRICRELLNAWWDDHLPKEMIEIVSIAQPLEGVSGEMLDYMAIRANGVARFNKAINELINIIGIAVSQDGEVFIEYSKNHFGSASIIIVYKAHHTRQSLDDVFKNTSEIVASWKAYYPDYSVDLIMRSMGNNYCHRQF